ncbi:pro-corazonin-like [Macrosteles quadrilineatus]|uniref:pro-corazonin-like n=1 Tax=Macrosteles quadrilineatus TaxID=74068 RepID=UPI0023E27706|nr:pro-corazonin-like [Macrosteles quadrilineatus]
MVSRHPTSTLLVLCCLAGVVLAQTFQYSHGWTNGKKRSGLPPSPHEAACQLQKLRIILEGKNTPQLYWPCDWQSSPDYEAHHMPPPPPLMDVDNN